MLALLVCAGHHFKLYIDDDIDIIWHQDILLLSFLPLRSCHVRGWKDVYSSIGGLKGETGQGEYFFKNIVSSYLYPKIILTWLYRVHCSILWLVQPLVAFIVCNPESHVVVHTEDGTQHTWPTTSTVFIFFHDHQIWWYFLIEGEWFVTFADFPAIWKNWRALVHYTSDTCNQCTILCVMLIQATDLWLEIEN